MENKLKVFQLQYKYKNEVLTMQKDLVLVNSRELSSSEVQLAIDLYTSSFGEIIKENSRINKLIDELLNENKSLHKYKDFYTDYSKEYNSGY